MGDSASITRSNGKSRLIAVVAVVAIASVALLISLASAQAESITACSDGSAVTIDGTEQSSTELIQGTEGNDVVVLANGQGFVGNGGRDLLCDQGGEVLGVALNDEVGEENSELRAPIEPVPAPDGE